MIVAIVGSRGFTDYSFLHKRIRKIMRLYHISCIVSGGANGADSLAERFAQEHGISLKVFKPDWDQFGKRAGILRNIEIVKASDVVVAFWDQKSRGTEFTINECKRQGKQCIKYHI